MWADDQSETVVVCVLYFRFALSRLHVKHFVSGKRKESWEKKRKKKEGIVNWQAITYWIFDEVCEITVSVSALLPELGKGQPPSKRCFKWFWKEATGFFSIPFKTSFGRPPLFCDHCSLGKKGSHLHGAGIAEHSILAHSCVECYLRELRLVFFVRLLCALVAKKKITWNGSFKVIKPAAFLVAFPSVCTI